MHADENVANCSHDNDNLESKYIFTGKFDWSVLRFPNRLQPVLFQSVGETRDAGVNTNNQKYLCLRHVSERYSVTSYHLNLILYANKANKIDGNE